MQIPVDSLVTLLQARQNAGALPNWTLVLMLFGWFLVIVLLIVRARDFKKYAQDFPTQAATVIVGLAAIVATTPVVLARIALGQELGEGTNAWLIFLGALVGVMVGGLAVKRFSSDEYLRAKGDADAARLSATGQFQVPPAPQVSVENATVNTAPATPAPAKMQPKPPVAHALQTSAAIRETRAQTVDLPDVPGEGD
jgi:hypothetical protein